MERSAMATRRKIIAALAASAAAAVLAASFAARAAPPTIEIIALSHWPVQNALKPVRDFLASLGDKVKIVEIDAESPAGEKRLAALGLKGHVPMALVIDGSDQFKRPDGTAVLFKDFPAKADNPLGINGSWTVADFQNAVNAALGTGVK
jgi:ABC-type glycerol-3-phosphate transport system substrate-binding protein